MSSVQQKTENMVVSSGAASSQICLAFGALSFSSGSGRTAPQPAHIPTHPVTSPAQRGGRRHLPSPEGPAEAVFDQLAEDFLTLLQLKVLATCCLLCLKDLPTQRVLLVKGGNCYRLQSSANSPEAKRGSLLAQPGHFFPLNMARGWHWLPRGAVAAPSLQVFSDRLDRA